MLQTYLMALPLPPGNLARYRQHMVKSYPRFDENEERLLAECLVEINELSAAYTLIISHLRYVLYIAVIRMLAARRCPDHSCSPSTIDNQLDGHD